MNKKRFLYTVPLALVLLLGACGKNDSSSVESSKSEASQSTTISSSTQSSKLESSSSVESKPSSEVSSTVQPVSTNTPSTNTTPTTNTNTNNTNNTGNTNNTSHSTTNTNSPTQSDSGSSANPGSSTDSSGGESSSELPTNAAYYVRYDEQEIALKENNGNLLENQEAEYKGELGNIIKNKEIVILDESKNPITENIGPDKDNNNIVISEGKYVVHNDAENASIYFKKWKDGGMSFYVSGYHDHVSAGLGHRKTRSDGGRHRFFDQTHFPGARPLRAVLHGPGLHFRDSGGDGYEHAGLHKTVTRRHQHFGLGDKVPEHFTGDVEVRNHSALHRTDRLDIQRTTVQHPVRLLPNRDHLFGQCIDSDHGRLGENDPLVLHIHKAVRRPQIDPDVAGKKLCQFLMYHRDFLQSDFSVPAENRRIYTRTAI